MAMGAIIGVTAWQRTQEKIAMYRSDNPFTGGTVTEHTVDRTSTTGTTTPAKVNIKTDAVNVSTSTDVTNEGEPKMPSRAD